VLIGLRSQYDHSEELHKNKQGTNTSSSVNKPGLYFYHNIYVMRPKSKCTALLGTVLDVTFRGSPRLKTPVAVTAKLAFRTSKPLCCNNHFFACVTRYRSTFTVCTFMPLSALQLHHSPLAPADGLHTTSSRVQ
jgi:hypothetical protein